MKINWLRQRSEIMAKYATSLPTTLDRVKLTFDFPEYGWMPVHFFKNEQEMGFVEFSDVYDSFKPFRQWLEILAEIGNSRASVTCLDCESSHTVLYYEPVWFYDREIYGVERCPADCGIFSVYDEAADRFILDAYCDTSLFVRDLYQSLMDFVSAMHKRPDFTEHWRMSDWNDNWEEDDEEETKSKEIFLSTLKSPIIEAYVKDSMKWRHQ